MCICTRVCAGRSADERLLTYKAACIPPRSRICSAWTAVIRTRSSRSERLDWSWASCELRCENWRCLPIEVAAEEEVDVEVEASPAPPVPVGRVD